MRTFEGAAVSKKQREVSGEPEGQYRNAPEWRGPCCEGFHWWGHGAGYAVKNAATECEWRCMESRCRKKLEKKVPEAEYKKWNDQWKADEAKLGVEEARALWLAAEMVF